MITDKERKLRSPFPLCFAFEFRTKCAIKGYLKQLGDLRRQGKLNDKIQAEIKEEYEKQTKIIGKCLNEQFPNRFVEEEKTAEQHPDHEKPKSDIAYERR